MRFATLVSIAFLTVACAGGGTTPIPPAKTISPLSEWPVYRHDSLGVQVNYPPGWRVDSTPASRWFNDPGGQSFNIVNAGFPMSTPADFLNYLGPPVLMTETLVLGGQPALYVQLEPVPEAEGYHSVVAIITPDGRGLTIGNKSDPLIFEQALTTIRFFSPSNPP